MLDHISLQVADPAASAAFYDRVLAPLGSTRLLDFGQVIGWGTTQPRFWIGPVTKEGTARELHVAFEAADRAHVRAFFEAAVATGAEVLHEPRVWPEYHPAYYGAFVRDPDGNNVEAVCHGPSRPAPNTSVREWLTSSPGRVNLPIEFTGTVNWRNELRSWWVRSMPLTRYGGRAAASRRPQAAGPGVSVSVWIRAVGG